MAAVPASVSRVPRPLLYVADTHFGHADIIEFADRPFRTVEEMDRRMLGELRAAKDRGPVVHPGDLTLDPPKTFVERYGLPCPSPGHHTLVAGHHNRVTGHRAAYGALFRAVVGTEDTWRENATLVEDTLRSEPIRVLLSHAPQRDLRGSNVNLHGHHHNLIERFPNTFRLRLGWLLESDRHYNVSVELIDYRPRTLDELHALRFEEGRDLH